MKNSFIKVTNCVPELKIADPHFNYISIKKMIEDNIDSSIILFPELCLCGYTCQDLFFQKTLQDECLMHLVEIAKLTTHSDSTVIVSLPIQFKNKLYNCAAICSDGQVKGLVPKINIPNYGEFYENRWFASGIDLDDIFTCEYFTTPISSKIIFEDSITKAILGVEICEDLWVISSPNISLIENGCNIIVNPSSSNETISKSNYRRELVNNVSSKGYCLYMYCSSNYSESSQDLLFSGHNIIAYNGKILKDSEYTSDNSSITTIIDLDESGYNRIHQSTFINKESNYKHIDVKIKPLGNKRDIEVEKLLPLLSDYEISKYPFIPHNEVKREERCKEILKIQTYGLISRIKNTSIYDLVIGVSGGLDSTLALLVCNEVKKILKKVVIHAITMPNEGNTTEQTKNNAIDLIKSLGIEPVEIPIKDGVISHLKDINHPLEYLGEKDTAYENAQARMRTYILMDIANMNNGMVIGTGDLSELALGWCTYNGDHMAMYSLNSSIPKTLVQYLVKTYAECFASKETKETLFKILDTPITPELTPNMNGKITQKTEEKIGKYDLNDFFMFYLLRYGYTVDKIYLLTKLAYPELENEFIKESMKRFYSRFFSQQFKRSCLPDGVKVGSVSLSPRGDYRMPSDASANTFLKEIEEL